VNKGLRSSNCLRLALANEAWIRNDLHVVKYTRAAFDMGLSILSTFCFASLARIMSARSGSMNALARNCAIIFLSDEQLMLATVGPAFGDHMWQPGVTDPGYNAFVPCKP
jgi:hypothetical protein